MDTRKAGRKLPRSAATLGALLLIVAARPAVNLAQEALTDICACAAFPDSLGNFVASDTSTYPPGTTRSGGSITIPLPADGVLVFDSFNLNHSPGNTCVVAGVHFARNASNTPVTILVKNDLTIGTDCFGRRSFISVSGATGSDGSAGAAGSGGLGGPGGFRGGDGAYRLSNLASDGGAGFGPGGGSPALALPFTRANGGRFLGLPELVPLVGASGGGGGMSDSEGTACAGGGGGGGGGAILIAANGRITVNGSIFADGGAGGTRGNSACSSGGGGGSGGAIRLIASAISGTGELLARGGGGGCCSDHPANGGTNGSVRLEAPSITLPSTSTDSPVAIRVPAPGPLVSPLAPTVTITHVAGALVTQPPTGGVGGIDIIVSAPGVIGIDLATSGVPSGTTLEVTVKPRVGGVPIVANTTLVNCDVTGNCLASVPIDLASGSYVIEARATFATPSP